MKLAKFLLVALFAAFSLSTAHAETITVGPEDDWFKWLSGNELKPGDELVLREGTYSDARRLSIRHSGTFDNPVVIRATEEAKVVFKRPDAKQNTFNLEGAQYLHLIGFEITGGAAGIRIGPHQDRQSRSVHLQQLHIHHIGGVAVTCNHPGATYRDMDFRDNHIHHTSGHGEAFYLGGNDASAIISDSFIVNNYIHDLNGTDVSQGDGIEIKTGSWGNTVLGNVIHDTNYPGIIVYGTSETKTDRSRNVIENNIIWNTGDHGIQAAADAIVRKNFIANAKGCGIYSREHQAATPQNLLIEHNSIAATNQPAIRIIGSPKKQKSLIEIMGNALFAENGHPAMRIENITQIKIQNNRGEGDIVGVDARLNESQKPEEKLVFPLLKNNPAWEFLDRQDVMLKFRR